MVYLFLGKNNIKVIGMTKTLLGQYTVAHFAKTHSSPFVVDGALQSTDLIAGAVKEALSSAQPAPLTDREISLTLPQELFTFGRYTIPSDISPSALMPFVHDKARTDMKLHLENVHIDYLIVTRETVQTVFIYAIDKSIFDSLKGTLSLIQLKIQRIIPETLAYYTLFEKTLRNDKKEFVLYANYESHDAYAYLYDSAGLLKEKRFEFGEDFKTDMHATVVALEQENTKLNRLILSGTESRSVRQDLFTKDVGAWTNPLEKIIDNFYKDYLKMIIPQENGSLSVLQYDVCFGTFIFIEEHKEFTLMNGGASSQSSSFSFSRPKPAQQSMQNPAGRSIMREIFNLKTLGIFALSFAISFGIMYGGSYLKASGWKIPALPQLSEKMASKPTPKPTVKPVKTPTPTPEIDRATLKVKVLNGGGVPGKAGEVKTILQDAGYTDIVTANADAFDFAKTEVQLSKKATDALPLIKKDLADYVKIVDAKTISDTDETADIIITIGEDFQ